ncbi:MAG: TIGR03986 family CRISPR-associated RAMP protein [Bacteroidota bacterium]
MTKIIKAPYNFVPLNKKVVLPYWADHISHDIPFADAQSGTLKIGIKAETPIFVLDGTKDKEKEGQVGSFNHFDGKYFLPGSSIKGMLRAVLEIMSFGKLADQVDDDRYAIRDLAGSMKNTYMGNFKPDQIRCGWLQRLDENEYIIKDCGLPGRISHRHLDAEFGTNFSTFFKKRSEGGNFNASNDKEKAAQYKYKKFREKQSSFEHRFDFVTTDANRPIYEVGREHTGTIVFTGQPGPRMIDRRGKWTGHHLEFIFFEEKERLEVTPKVIKDFLFAYYDHDVNQQSVDWQHWSKILEKGERIPVFFQKEGDKVKHLGLSYLYKLPYENSIREAIAHYQPTEGIDIAQAIFGYVDDKSKASLKGRVHVGHAFAKANTAREDKQFEAVLSSPKASYFPNYLRQDIKGDGKVGRYTTLMDKKPELAGWKRYPVHQKGRKKNPAPQGTKNPDKILTKFVPLEEGVIFELDINYHNLKLIELGALLSALTFHGTAGNSHKKVSIFHSIGMGKPLGFGRVSVVVTGIEEKLKTASLKAFEAYMNVELEEAWHNSTQITELLTMSSVQDNKGSSELAYMKMGMGKGKNEFVEAKSRQNREALNRYSQLDHVQAITANTLITPKDIEQMQAYLAREKAIYERMSTPDEILEAYEAQKEAELYRALEAKKDALLKALEQKREALQTEEEKQLAQERAAASAKKKAEKQAAAQAAGFDFTELDPEEKNFFNTLKKHLQLHLARLHKVNNYNQIRNRRSKFPDILLPKEQHQALHDFLLRAIAAGASSEQKRWKKPFKKNANFKKVAEWVGEEKAEKWYQELIK